MLRKLLLAGLAGAFLFSGNAFAQDADEQNTDDQTQEAVVPTEPTVNRAVPRNLALELGVGVANFNGGLGEQMTAGPSWDLRGILNADETVGVEVAYVGIASNLEGTDLETGADLDGTALTSAGDAMARFNALKDEFIQPFASAGLGVLSVDVRDQDTTVDRGTSLTIPVGAGLQVYTDSALTFGGRFNYRILTDVFANDLPSGDNWNLGVNVGATF